MGPLSRLIMQGALFYYVLIEKKRGCQPRSPRKRHNMIKGPDLQVLDERYIGTHIWTGR